MIGKLEKQKVLNIFKKINTVYLIYLLFVTESIGSIERFISPRFDSYYIYGYDFDGEPAISGFIANIPLVAMAFYAVGFFLLLSLYIIFRFFIKEKRIPKLVKFLIIAFWGFIGFICIKDGIKDLIIMLKYKFILSVLPDFIIALIFVFSIKEYWDLTNRESV